jgi:hypothetical protein
LYEDDDTEEGEEKPRTVITTNGNGHSLPLIIPTTTLVGAKRRKCNIAHKINLEDKVIDHKIHLIFILLNISFRISNHHHLHYSIIPDDQVVILSVISQ